MTKNKLPYSNQFERGHSFNRAGKWTAGKYYMNDEYVTDFVVYESNVNYSDTFRGYTKLGSGTDNERFGVKTLVENDITNNYTL